MLARLYVSVLVLMTLPSLAFASGIDARSFVELMKQINTQHFLGQLQIQESIEGVPTQLTEKNASINGRECLFTMARFQGSELDLAERPPKRIPNVHMTNNLLLKYELKPGENAHLPTQYEGKYYLEFGGRSAVGVNEINGYSVPKTRFASTLVSVKEDTVTEEGKTYRRFVIVNSHNLDWGPNSLRVRGEILLNENQLVRTTMSLIVDPKIRDNPPAGYVLPNDVHLTCKFAPAKS